MTETSASPSDQNSGEHYKTLLEISETVCQNRDLQALFRRLAELLPQIVPVDFLALVLHDPQRHVVKDFLIQANVPADIEGGKEWQLNDHPAGTVFLTQNPIFIPDISRDDRYPIVFSRMQEDGAKSLCIFPLTTAFRKLGSIIFSSCNRETYRESDYGFLNQVVKHIAVAVDNVLHFQELTQERDHSRLLLEINNAIVATLDLKELFASISNSLRRLIPHEITSLYLYDAETRSFRRHILEFPGGKGLIQTGGIIGIEDTPARHAFHKRSPAIWTEADMKTYQSETVRHLLDEGMKFGLSIPLLLRGQVLGTLNIGSFQEMDFEEGVPELLTQVAGQVAIALDNSLAYQKIKDLKGKVERENMYLREEIRTEKNFEDIIGESAVLKRVLKQLEIVAPTDSTVLILGETGTGKELIARALHQLSSRKDLPFVKINCAAIPTGLLESELFGHEKGAFTGAIAQKIGRFELAHRGTIFLDEVGEISLELQSKLLRVLQEQEFERLGSTKTLKVNVRLIAATNRDLENMVEGNQFRSDLYYRLNVFPITVPPLRERPEDIAMLVRYFTQRFATRLHKPIETISQNTLDQLCQYSWPGNVRELENFIERAVILSQGSVLTIPTAEFKSSPRPAKLSRRSNTTLEGVERNHILEVLRETGWVIGGSAGAAARLGMKRTTLTSKMKKLNISRPM